MDVASVNARMKKFANDAGTFFNRAKQYTEEKLGSAEKTELDAHFENLLLRADKTRIWTEKVLHQTEAVLQPNPNVRMEDFFYEKLDKKKRDRQTSYELLGQAMIDAGNEFGPGTAYGNALVKCGQTQVQIGGAEKEFVSTTANDFLHPFQSFLNDDIKTIQKERKILETKRLDLDVCKNKLRKAKSQAEQQKAEADLRVSQAEFDRQSEITKLLLEGLSSTHAHHLRCLNDFIEAQMTYYAQCQQYMSDLRRDLGSSSVGGGNGSLSNIHTPANSSSKAPARPSAPPVIEVTEASPTDRQKARVLYDYDAADSSELSLLADELITICKVPGMDLDWLMAERGSQRGKVPVTYLEIIG